MIQLSRLWISSALIGSACTLLSTQAAASTIQESADGQQHGASETQPAASNSAQRNAARDQGTSDNLLDIVVTANKSAQGLSVQRTPIAVTAFDQSRIETGHVESISDLTNFVPNVYLNSGAVTPGVNNFSIRGAGVYSTIPSTTPTVGVFVDGVYVGANAGTALKNTFDLEGIEVLRGPQGLLFGRNVTAGAILLRTIEPSSTPLVRADVAVESGPLYRGSALVSGPLGDSDILAGKVAVSYTNDRGYFTNLGNGDSHFGKDVTSIFHGALTFKPSATFVNVLRVETGSEDADGPAGQNHAKFGRNTFDFELDTTGFNKLNWTNATLESRLGLGSGDGQVVNIAGWRKISADSLSDADSTTLLDLNLATYIDHHQFSDELRYSGTIGGVDATVGVYYYTDKLVYVETRDLAKGAVHRIGGGNQDSTTWAAFSNFNIHLGEALIINLGARYSTESKSAKVAVLQNVGPSNPCLPSILSCKSFNFRDKDRWNAFTPKIGFQWQPNGNTNLYGYYTKGFRSGGYNLRQTQPLSPPGPYDQEVVNSFELGLKQKAFAGRLNLALAAFTNQFKDLQRDIAFTDPLLGVVQTTANTADATIRGFEAEFHWLVVPGLTFGGNLGYLHGKIDKLKHALSPSGIITPDQLRLKIPFLSPWSYGLNVNYKQPVPWGQISATAAFQHLDRQFSNDQNTGILNPVNNLDLDLTSEFARSRLKASVYVKNLLDRTTFGVDSPLPFTPGQTFSPLNKGRVIGFRLAYAY